MIEGAVATQLCNNINNNIFTTDAMAVKKLVMITIEIISNSFSVPLTVCIEKGECYLRTMLFIHTWLETFFVLDKL